ADLGGVAFVAVFVVPLPGLQTAFDVDLLPLGQIFVERLRRFPPEDDAVPFGFFLTLPGLVVPDFSRRHVECGDGCASWRVPQFCVTTEIADENHFIDAAHGRALYIVALMTLTGDRAPASRDS